MFAKISKHWLILNVAVHRKIWYADILSIRMHLFPIKISYFLLCFSSSTDQINSDSEKKSHFNFLKVYIS